MKVLGQKRTRGKERDRKRRKKKEEEPKVKASRQKEKEKKGFSKDDGVELGASSGPRNVGKNDNCWWP